MTQHGKGILVALIVLIAMCAVLLASWRTMERTHAAMVEQMGGMQDRSAALHAENQALWLELQMLRAENTPEHTTLLDRDDSMSLAGTPRAQDLAEGLDWQTEMLHRYTLLERALPDEASRLQLQLSQQEWAEAVQSEQQLWLVLEQSHSSPPEMQDTLRALENLQYRERALFLQALLEILDM